MEVNFTVEQEVGLARWGQNMLEIRWNSLRSILGSVKSC